LKKYNLSKKLINSFIKAFSLPIPLILEHFDYYIEILDPYYDTKKKLSFFYKLIDEAQLHNSNIEEWFFNSSNNIYKSIINDISSKPKYIQFTNMALKEFEVKSLTTSSSLYNNAHVGKFFCSIDLKKANYQALNLISNELVLNTKSYREIIEKYTHENCVDFFANSKSIRQQIFGNLQPKKQQKIQKYILNQVVELLIDLNVSQCHIISCSSDEICFELLDYDITSIKDVISKKFPFEFHIETFKLCLVKEDTTLYYKEDTIDGKITFKAIPSHNILECIKYIEKKEIDYRDKLFLFEGRVSSFKDDLL